MEEDFESEEEASSVEGKLAEISSVLDEIREVLVGIGASLEKIASK